MSKLIVLADLGCLKVYRVTRPEGAATPRIELVERVEPEEAHRRLGERVTDQAGRFRGGAGRNGGNGAGGAGASHGENHNFELETRRRLARRMADSITAVVRREGVAVWDFAAPGEVGGRILEGVEAGVRSRLRRRVVADLTKVAKGELLAHFG